MSQMNNEKSEEGVLRATRAGEMNIPEPIWIPRVKATPSQKESIFFWGTVGEEKTEVEGEDSVSSTSFRSGVATEGGDSRAILEYAKSQVATARNGMEWNTKMSREIRGGAAGGYQI